MQETAKICGHRRFCVEKIGIGGGGGVVNKVDVDGCSRYVLVRARILCAMRQQTL